MRLAQSGVRRGQDDRHDGRPAAGDRSWRSAPVGDVPALAAPSCPERLFAAAVTLLRPGGGDWEKLRAYCWPGAGASVTAAGNGRSGQAAGRDNRVHGRPRAGAL